jgi:hypothetical protein
MSEDIIKSIKDIAHSVSEDYLLFKKNMNDAIVDHYLNGEIENDEIVKRICEQANQNVYLGMFNDDSVNKANITFELADFNQIIPIIRESEKAMNELKTPPVDFRTKGNLAHAVTPVQNETGPEAEENETGPKSFSEFAKQSELHTVIQFRNTLKNFLEKVAMMKCAEEKAAEEAFGRMRHDAKIVVAKGDSLGDLAKIAARSVKEVGGNFTKVAQAYEDIRKELVENNFHVNIEFTKLSSMRINQKAEILKPVNDFSLAMAKIAGFTEMQQNLSRVLVVFNKTITEEIRK